MTLSLGEYTCRVNGIELWYEVKGKGPVVIIQPPGWGIGGEVYEQFLKPLESEFTLIYYDPRGSGKSQSPANPEDLNVGWFVQDLEALRAHIGLDSFALIGHSHGGLIALNYALKYQRRLSHLIPMDSQLDGGEEYENDTQKALSELASDAKFAAALKFLESEGGFGAMFQLKLDSEVSAFMERVMPLYFKNTMHAAILQEYVKTHRIALAALLATGESDERFPVVDKLDSIRVPTLVVVGRYDILCPPRQANIIHERIKGSKQVVFENSGHFPWVEEPALFFPIVTDFLKGNPTRRADKSNIANPKPKRRAG